MLSKLDGIGAGHRSDLHRFEDAAAVRLGAEIKPQRRIDIAGVAGLDVEAGESLDVSSVGWYENPLRLPFSADNPDIEIGRHAIAIDEPRACFRSNLGMPTNPPRQT